MFGRHRERQELLDRNGVALAISEMIAVANDGTLLEVEQANLALIEDVRIVICRIFSQEFGVPRNEDHRCGTHRDGNFTS